MYGRFHILIFRIHLCVTKGDVVAESGNFNVERKFFKSTAYTLKLRGLVGNVSKHYQICLAYYPRAIFSQCSYSLDFTFPLLFLLFLKMNRGHWSGIAAYVSTLWQQAAGVFCDVPHKHWELYQQMSAHSHVHFQQPVRPSHLRWWPPASGTHGPGLQSPA
jgi:hypothetical protein